jgi:hypothetical protein
MAYTTDEKTLIPDLIARKEFYWTKRWDIDKLKPITDNIIPRFLLNESISKGGNLKLLGHQHFVANYLNPNTEYKRLHLKWSTGSGKTIAGLSIAMNFIKNYRLQNELGQEKIGSVFVIGFSERVFKADLLRFPEFGFLSKEEKTKLEQLKKQSTSGDPIYMEKYKDFTTKIKKRFTNRKGNGFFKFFGYKAFVNRIFVSSEKANIAELSEQEIIAALKAGTIKYNTELLSEFKNSLIVADEIHNVYNTAEKNNWGIAIQAVLDLEPSVRIVTLSATPFNNSPTEVVDLLNLLLPTDKRLRKLDLFNKDASLKPGALEKIAKLSVGRFSFLTDVNPKNYPKLINIGDSVKGISYIKLIRCPMSPFHYKTYKKIFTGVLSQESQYINDFVLPNPEDPDIGIYQTGQIKQLAIAPQKWKDKNEINYHNSRIVGDILLRENIKTYSSKYAKLLDEIMYSIKNDGGKIFIYHNVVHMSGVVFIEDLLNKNGFLDEFSQSSANTICVMCGKTKKEHSKEQILGAYEANAYDNTYSIHSEQILGSYESLATSEFNSAQHEDDTEPVLDSKDDNPLLKSGLTKDPVNYTVDTTNIEESDLKENYNPIKGWESYKNCKTMLFGDTLLYCIYKRQKPYRFDYIPMLYESLTNMNEDAIKVLNSTIETNENDLLIRVKNTDEGIMKYLLGNGFKVLKGDKINSYLLKHGVKKDNIISDAEKLGGKVDKLSSKVDSSKVDSNKSNDIKKHIFRPARYIMAHSEIDKPRLEASLEKYNNYDNINGQNILILIGSKIIKESYDLKAIQNLFIVGRPDNIPTLIQIRGRAVRKDSHRGLPPEKRIVRFKILTTSLPDGSLSHEEIKYKEKIESFKTIQEIEKVLHENALDASLNYERNQQVEDPLGSLPYKPAKEIHISKLNLSTFDIYYAKQEVEIIKYIIKRLFIEYSTVWDHDDLFKAVCNPPGHYDVEVDTKLFTEENFLIALNHLVYKDDANYVEPMKKSIVGSGEMGIVGSGEMGIVGSGEKSITSSTSAATPSKFKPFIPDDEIFGGDAGENYKELEQSAITGGKVESGVSTSSRITPMYEIKEDVSRTINNLYDQSEKVLVLPDGQTYAIIPMYDKSQYYILFPINESNEPEVDIDLPYRLMKQETQKIININSFVQTKRVDFDYVDKKKIFFKRYGDTNIENMQNVVCEYGAAFHLKFVEECIEYVFNVWTSPTQDKSEMHEFYFKMLYYYDLLSLVIWAYTCKPRIFKDYTKYAIPVKAKDIKLKTLSQYEKRKNELADISPDDSSDLVSSGVINLLKSTFNRTSNTWIPAEFAKEYNKTIKKSSELYSGKKKKSKQINKVPANLLPIGHFISKFPKMYHPEKGWDENPTYMQNEESFKENDLVIGFDERSQTGVHIRFKIRNPIHNIKKYKDQRETEKGTICKSKSKEYLTSVAKKLDITVPEKVNIDELCVLIRSKLIRYELKERIKKSNIKYFYFHYEQRPETK